MLCILMTTNVDVFFLDENEHKNKRKQISEFTIWPKSISINQQKKNNILLL